MWRLEWGLEAYPHHLKIILKVKLLHSRHISLGISSLIAGTRNSGAVMGVYYYPIQSTGNKQVKKLLKTNMRDKKRGCLAVSLFWNWLIKPPRVSDSHSPSFFTNQKLSLSSPSPLTPGSFLSVCTSCLPAQWGENRWYQQAVSNVQLGEPWVSSSSLFIF